METKVPISDLDQIVQKMIDRAIAQDPNDIVARLRQEELWSLRSAMALALAIKKNPEAEEAMDHIRSRLIELIANPGCPLKDPLPSESEESLSELYYNDQD